MNVAIYFLRGLSNYLDCRRPNKLLSLCSTASARLTSNIVALKMSDKMYRVHFINSNTAEKHVTRNG